MVFSEDMKRMSSYYSVKEFAALARVTVRTLHHYDRIGLLRPTARTDAGYRRYSSDDALRLQQVLFYRELGFPLEEIRRILDAPAFDGVAALREHRKALAARGQTIEQLIRTIDRTLEGLTMKNETVTDGDLYAGFTPEDVEEMEREVDARYDPEIVAESRRRVRNMTKREWSSMKDESDDVCRELARLLDRDPASPDVQAVIARHHAGIERFFTCSANTYRGLGELYVSDPRFRAQYDRYADGLADFLSRGMAIYAETLPG